MNFLCLDPQVVYRREKDGGLVFNPQNGTTIEVDRQAFRLIELFDGTRGSMDIYKLIKTEIKGSFSFQDCDRIIRRLIRYGFLTINSNARKDYNLIPVEPWFKGNALSAPEKVHLMVTRKCNFTCQGCYAQQVKGADLTKAQIKTLIDQLAKMRVFQIAIGGGEPFLREDLLEIVQYAHKKKVLPNITTNGSFIRKEIASSLKNYIGKIQFSLVAPEETTNDKYRSSGAWDGFIRGCRIARINKIKFGVNILITKATLLLLPQLTKLILNQGSAEINVLEPKPTKDQDKWFIANQLKKKDLRILQSILVQLQKKFPQLTLTVDCSLTKLMAHIPDNFLQKKGIFGCTAGRRFLTILSNGRVYPCSFLVKDSLFLGNVKKDTIETIWKKTTTLPSRIQSVRKNENLSQWLLNHCPAISDHNDCF